MASKKISQREAQQMRRRLRAMESQVQSWMSFAAAGVNGEAFREEVVTTRLHEFVRTSRQLGMLVVVEQFGDNFLRLRAHRRLHV